MDFDILVQKMGFAMLYTVVALILAFGLVALLLYKYRKDRLKDLAKVGIGTVLGVAIIATALFAAATFYMGVASMFSKFLVKVAAVVTGLGMAGGFIALMVVLTRYFNDNIVNDGYYYDYLEQNGLIVGVVVMLLILVAIYAVGKKRYVNDTKSVVYGAIAIAMSFALSYVRLFKLPQGGSVTFASLLPLMLYCAMFGTRRGVLVCVVYGFLQALQDTYIIHPLQCRRAPLCVACAVRHLRFRQLCGRRRLCRQIPALLVGVQLLHDG